MKIIPLTKNQVALVDDEDYEWLNQWKWSIHDSRGIYYAERWQKGKNLKMHRLLLNAPPKKQVDHINGNSLDNQKCNLRLCTVTQNQQNQRKKDRHASSIFKGIYWCSFYHKWRASITHNKKTIHLGYFDNEVEAAKAYDEKAKDLFGEFAYMNATLIAKELAK